MKLAVVGSRSFSNYEFLKKILEFHPCTQIISGGAKGADTLARQFAGEKGIPIKEFLPNWDKDGKAAGFIRNKQIVNACDELVAFWDGESRGTAHSIKLAEDAGKPVYKYWQDDSEEELFEGIGI
jgi:predicted Rossmann fold nucleotide-binding protein DprA/Smf involved in DNA uptake